MSRPATALAMRSGRRGGSRDVFFRGGERGGASNWALLVWAVPRAAVAMAAGKKGQALVDGCSRTNVPSIWAVGDVSVAPGHGPCHA